MFEKPIGNHYFTFVKITDNVWVILTHMHIHTCTHTYSLNEVIPRGVIILPRTAIENQAKTTVLGIRSLFLNCWSGKVVQFLNNVGIAIALDCLLEVDGKFFLLKTPRSSETGLGKNQLYLV